MPAPFDPPHKAHESHFRDQQPHPFEKQPDTEPEWFPKMPRPLFKPPVTSLAERSVQPVPTEPHVNPSAREAVALQNEYKNVHARRASLEARLDLGESLPVIRHLMDNRAQRESFSDFSIVFVADNGETTSVIPPGRGLERGSRREKELNNLLLKQVSRLEPQFTPEKVGEIEGEIQSATRQLAGIKRDLQARNVPVPEIPDRASLVWLDAGPVKSEITPATKKPVAQEAPPHIRNSSEKVLAEPSPRRKEEVNGYSRQEQADKHRLGKGRFLFEPVHQEQPGFPDDEFSWPAAPRNRSLAEKALKRERFQPQPDPRPRNWLKRKDTFEDQGSPPLPVAQQKTEKRPEVPPLIRDKQSEKRKETAPVVTPWKKTIDEKVTEDKLSVRSPVKTSAQKKPVDKDTGRSDPPVVDKTAKKSQDQVIPPAPPPPPASWLAARQRMGRSESRSKARGTTREPRVPDGSPISRIERLCLLKHPEKQEIAANLNSIRKILAENPGVSINDTMNRDWSGVTPMMGAAANGCSEMCVALIQELGANPFVQDETGKHLLHLLIAKRHKEHWSREDRENQMPLFKTALRHPAVSDNINKPDIFGLTPLHYACARRDPDYIQLLTDAGAAPGLKDRNGNDCFDILALGEQARVNIIALAISGSAIVDDASKLSSDYLVEGDKYIYAIRGDDGIGVGGCRHGEEGDLSYLCSVEDSGHFNRDINSLREIMGREAVKEQQSTNRERKPDSGETEQSDQVLKNKDSDLLDEKSSSTYVTANSVSDSADQVKRCKLDQGSIDFLTELSRQMKKNPPVVITKSPYLLSRGTDGIILKLHLEDGRPIIGKIPRTEKACKVFGLKKTNMPTNTLKQNLEWSGRVHKVLNNLMIPTNLPDEIEMDISFTPFIDGKTFSAILADNKRFSAVDIRKFMWDLVEQFEQLWEVGFYHTDAHSSNIIVDKEGKPHLFDFGRSKKKESGKDVIKADFMTIAHHALSMALGNPIITATKVKQAKKQERMSCLLYHHYEPHMKENEVVTDFLNDTGKDEYTELRALINWMIDQDPVDENTLKKLKRHEYFSGEEEGDDKSETRDISSIDSNELFDGRQKVADTDHKVNKGDTERSDQVRSSTRVSAKTQGIDSDQKVNPGEKVLSTADVDNNPLTPITTSSTSVISDQQPKQSSKSCFSYVPETRNHEGQYGRGDIQTVDYIDTSFICHRSADEVLDLFETAGLLVTKTDTPFSHLPGGGKDIEIEEYCNSWKKEKKGGKDFVCTTHVENQLKVPLYSTTSIGLIMEPDNISETISIGKVDIMSHDDHKGADAKEVEQQIIYDQRTGARLDEPQAKRDSEGNIKKKKVVSVFSRNKGTYETREQLSEALAYDQFREKQGLFSRQDGRRIKSAKIHNEVNIKTKHPYTIAGFLFDQEIDKLLSEFDLIPRGNIKATALLQFCYIICNSNAPLFKYEANGKLEIFDKGEFLDHVILAQFTKKYGIPPNMVLEQMKLLSNKEKSSKDCMEHLIKNMTNEKETIATERKRTAFQSLFETLTRFKEDLEKHPEKTSVAQDRTGRPGVDDLMSQISLDSTQNPINKERFVTQLKKLKRQSKRFKK